VILAVRIVGDAPDRRVRVIGDPAGFFWLQQAANNAMNGHRGAGDEVLLTDGGGVLEIAFDGVVMAVR